RPAQSENGMPFAALGDLLDGLPDEVLHQLPGPQRRALEVALLRVADHDEPPDQRAIGVALLSTLRLMSAKSPLLLAVGDAQWLDAPTSDALTFAVRRLRTEAVGVLSAVRLADEPAATFDQAVPEPTRQVLTLGGLSIGALHELFSQRLGHAFARPTLVTIEQASGGNPFYALETARELLRAGA